MTMTRKDFIASQIALGLDRQTIVSSTMKAFNLPSRDTVENHVGVTLWELRQAGIIEKPIKDSRPSRHSIIKRGLAKDLSNSKIVMMVQKVHPEVPLKQIKQRVCEYRWFHNQGIK